MGLNSSFLNLTTQTLHINILSSLSSRDSRSVKLIYLAINFAQNSFTRQQLCWTRFPLPKHITIQHKVCWAQKLEHRTETWLCEIFLARLFSDFALCFWVKFGLVGFSKQRAVSAFFTGCGDNILVITKHFETVAFHMRPRKHRMG